MAFQKFFPECARPFHRIERGMDIFEFRTLADCFAAAQEAFSQNRQAFTATISEDWAGIGEQWPEYLRQQGAQKALDAFRAAQASFPLHGAPDAPIARPNGGAWVIPEVLIGSPLPARIRPRTALPLRKLQMHLSFSANIDYAVVAGNTARIARAAWEYVLKGGIVECSAIYEAQYSSDRPTERGTSGVVFIIHANLASEWEIAQAISVQVFRGAFLGTACAMDPRYGGGLPVSRTFATKNTINLIGNKNSDDRELQKHGIE